MVQIAFAKSCENCPQFVVDRGSLASGEDVGQG